MNRKKFVIATAAVAALTLGAFGSAYAWKGDFGHHAASRHEVLKHGYDQLPLGQMVAANFNEHGGGHETAPNNAAIHDAEMNSPAHKNSVKVNPAVKFNEHGGGHETAPDNAVTHEKEMKDPNHKDVIS